MNFWHRLTDKSFHFVLFSLRISQVEQHEKFLESKENKAELLLDHLNDKYLLICREIVEFLNEGLKERVELIFPLASNDESDRTVRNLV